MWHIPMVYISLTAALALSASAANAGSVVVHTTTPNVKVQTPHIGSQTSGAGAGKVTFNPFHVTKTIDKSSNTLFQGVYSGKHFTAGKGSGGATAYDDKQKGSENPKESVSFTYGKVEWQYQQQK
jgi:type VI protein secretion system component Hcp